MALADYRIVGPLGRMLHRAVGRRGPVALKLGGPELLAEARILDRLDHPCIPRVHERGIGYVAMDGCGSHPDHAASRTDFRSGFSVRFIA